MARRRFGGWIGLLAAAVFCSAMGGSSARAHDFSITTSFGCVGGGTCAQESEHEDEDPFKGWAYLTVTNTGSEGWGDFHFELFQVGAESIDNVFFDVSSPNQPVSSQSGLTWSLSGDGHTLDLFFYNDPVLLNQTLILNVYTDNTTDQVSFFGTLYYPTPIPEVSTALLLGSGLIGLAIARRRSRR